MRNVRIMQFEGQIDALTQSWITGELAQIEDFADGTLTILDVRGVQYLDSTFVNALVRLRNRLSKVKPTLGICLVATRGHIAWRLFEITKMTSLFPIYEDLPSARRNGLSVLPGAIRNSARSVARRSRKTTTSRCSPQRFRRYDGPTGA